jgi:hypothetical protein
MIDSDDYIKVLENGDIIKRFDVKKNQIAFGILFRSQVLFSLSLYNKKLRINEEKDLKKRFLKNNYRIGYVELPLYRYVIHDNNMTKNK